MTKNSVEQAAEQPLQHTDDVMVSMRYGDLSPLVAPPDGAQHCKLL